MKILKHQIRIFCLLLQTKFATINRVLTDKSIDFYIWEVCTLLVSGYLMQSFGLSSDYGPFQLGSILASLGLFEMYGNAITLISDIEGERVISYYLTIPTNAITVLSSYVFYYTIINTIITIVAIPIAKIILLDKFILANVAWLQLLLFIVLMNFVCATATLLFSAFIPSIDKVGRIWMRIIFPLWFLGGFNFSWFSVNAKIPWISYFMLLNPITYMTEGIRAALIGQDGNLNFWLCCVVLTITFGVTSILAYKALKKRLDFVG